MDFFTNEDVFLRLLKENTLAAPAELKLSLLSNKASTLENIKDLLAEEVYKNTIQLLPHQKKSALKVLNEFTHRALLADEVGLGKTIEAGMIIKEYLVRKMVKKVLILTPASLTLQWQEELRSKFKEDFFVATKPEDWDQYELIIASIDTAKTERNSKIICSLHWDLLVVDEAHKLKNKQSLNYKFVKKISKERFLMLTATPLQNNIYELWNLIDLLHPGFLGTSKQFQEQFVKDKLGLDIAHGEELQKKLSRIMIRNLRRNTNIKFVDRRVNTVLLDYHEQQLKFYQDVLSFIKKQYVALAQEAKKTEEADEETISTAELKQLASDYRRKGLLGFALIMLTRQISSSFRTGVKALERYKEGLKDEAQLREIDSLILCGKQFTEDQKLDAIIKLIKKYKTKVIIFTTFLESQKNILVELALNNISAVSFNGIMNLEEKEDAIAQFKGDKQVFVCTDAGSEGRNLQFAHILINYDLPWNPMRVEQRIGRVHRIGQTDDVEIINLAFNHTIEAYILSRLYEKIDLFRTAVGEMDAVLSELKTGKSFEVSVFESVIESKDAQGLQKNLDNISKQLETAKKENEKVKEFDEKIFSTMHVGEKNE
ncbi:DEAD/DEAH box helicase family protein [Candidatus Woesearchaeota archaeon]|nr:DEAD/DEAH box helicase family protein [Candidatus Woesearchaeota archaeon]